MGKRREHTSVLKDDNESYKHALAKGVLKSWLAEDFEVLDEVKFICEDWIFISDIATFLNGHLQALYEVTHTHEIDGIKVMKMHDYCYRNGLDIYCHEVDAEWIMKQTKKPDIIQKITYDFTDYDKHRLNPDKIG